MPEAVRFALVAISLAFIAVGGYYRIQSQRSAERLDRTKEGWPILIGIRLLGLLTLGFTIVWLWKPAWFQWAAEPASDAVRWFGVMVFGCAVAWLIWMFRTLGRNLTDTVVTRKDAYLVRHGPYRYVRNPMGTWLIPAAGAAVFTLFALRTRIEERYLIERFGDQYRDYMRQVGRFFPRLFHEP